MICTHRSKEFGHCVEFYNFIAADWVNSNIAGRVTNGQDFLN
jgi:hypothetical protein